MKNFTFIQKFQVPEVAYHLIDKMFTEEEIRFVSKMEKDIFTEDDIKKMDLVNVKHFIKNSYHRGIISIVDNIKGSFKISNFYGRLDIYAISEMDKYKSFSRHDRDALDDWYFEAYYNGLGLKSDIPPSEDEIMPLGQALSFIDQQDRPVYLNYCDCRSLRGECGFPTKTCITYRNGINSFAHRGLSEEIDKEKAKEIVKRADKIGLMHTVNPNGICNCCGDCCYLFRGQIKRKSKGVWPKTTHIIDFDASLCIACGKCVNKCHFDVFQKEGNILIDIEKCVGCGICVQSCPTKALKLIEK